MSGIVSFDKGRTITYIVHTFWIFIGNYLFLIWRMIAMGLTLNTER